MAELSHPFTCDVCGVHKGEQNHWFRVWACSGSDETYAGVVIGPWIATDTVPAPLGHYHCCGEAHALRKAGELLGRIGLGGSSG
jgi:hypothetical protein